MAGIIHKIEEKLGMGGHKEGEKHDVHKAGGVCEVEHIKPENGHGEHKPEHGSGEHKEGLVDKIKDKIHGDGGHEEKGEKKKKKEKKKHEHGYEHSGESSSSDSD
ncbi:protein SRC1-like [Primulina huaijiensis]|uniref:protein SRC1-like n=1 Tax=Primulina huaijiensis TaxID=1492673 RepID=UPI003CC780AF